MDKKKKLKIDLELGMPKNFKGAKSGDVDTSKKLKGIDKPKPFKGMSTEGSLGMAEGAGLSVVSSMNKAKNARRATIKENEDKRKKSVESLMDNMSGRPVQRAKRREEDVKKFKKGVKRRESEQLDKRRLDDEAIINKDKYDLTMSGKAANGRTPAQLEESKKKSAKYKALMKKLSARK